MTLKNLLALSTVLGAAALLQNKERRERIFTGARELIGNARNKLSNAGASVSDASTASSSAF